MVCALRDVLAAILAIDCVLFTIHSEDTKPTGMDLTAIEAKSKALVKFGIGYVFLQGGCPLMRHDIMDIIDMFIKYGIQPVISNGILLTRERAKAIAVRKCNLAISVADLLRRGTPSFGERGIGQGANIGVIAH